MIILSFQRKTGFFFLCVFFLFTLHIFFPRLFLSFNLWIDNESLHESGVCLSALEPKYCPEWLELVLNGDKVMCLLFSLKCEIIYRTVCILCSSMIILHRCLYSLALYSFFSWWGWRTKTEKCTFKM